MFGGYHLAARGQDGNAIFQGVASALFRAGVRGAYLDAAAEDFGKNFSGGFTFFRREFLGGKKDIIINVEGGSRASDDTASDALCQLDFSRVASFTDFLQHKR